MSHTFGFYSWIWEESGEERATRSYWDEGETASGAHQPLLGASYQSIGSGNQATSAELPV